MYSKVMLKILHARLQQNVDQKRTLECDTENETLEPCVSPIKGMAMEREQNHNLIFRHAY